MNTASYADLPLFAPRTPPAQTHRPEPTASATTAQPSPAAASALSVEEKLRVWKRIEQAMREQTVLNARVVARVQGGLSVDIGIRAFLPGSQIAHRPIRQMQTLVGQTLPVRITHLDRVRGSIVVSRRATLPPETEGRPA